MVLTILLGLIILLIRWMKTNLFRIYGIYFVLSVSKISVSCYTYIYETSRLHLEILASRDILGKLKVKKLYST
jgi:hypothetical protein